MRNRCHFLNYCRSLSRAVSRFLYRDLFVNAVYTPVTCRYLINATGILNPVKFIKEGVPNNTQYVQYVYFNYP